MAQRRSILFARRAVELRKIADEFNVDSGPNMAAIIADEFERRAVEAKAQEVARAHEPKAEDNEGRSSE